MMSDSDKENYSHVDGSFYIVRTQAGFKQAMKHWWGEELGEVHGYPTAYPSLVSFSQGYNGGIYIRVSSLHLNMVSAAMTQSEKNNNG